MTMTNEETGIAPGKTMRQKDDNDLIIGDRVRQRRIAAKISQDELGKALGLTFQQVQKYEKGTNRLSVSRLIKIADALGCSVDCFYEGLTATGTPRTEKEARLALYSTSKEGILLIQAMASIESPKVRQQILSLARTISGLKE